MFFSMFFGVVLSVASLSTLVVGDSQHSLRFTQFEIEGEETEWWGKWTAEVKETPKSSELTINMPIKKEVPEEMMLRIVINMEGQDPIEKEMFLCDGFDDKAVGDGFVRAGTPDGFPIGCPIIPGDWTVKKWKPSMDPVPSGLEGRLWGFAAIGMDLDNPMIKFVYDADMTHGFK